MLSIGRVLGAHMNWKPWLLVLVFVSASLSGCIGESSDAQNPQLQAKIILNHGIEPIESMTIPMSLVEFQSLVSTIFHSHSRFTYRFLPLRLQMAVQE